MDRDYETQQKNYTLSLLATMSAFNRPEKLDVPDGHYCIFATFQGLPEKIYPLRVENGLPSILFTVSNPNSQPTYRIVPVRSEWIVQVPTGKTTYSFKITSVLASPYLMDISKPTGVNFEALYIALNMADTNQAILRYGEHILFASKGRATWISPLNFLMDYFHLVMGKEWLDAQTETSHPLSILMTVVRADFSSTPSDSQGNKAVSMDNPVTVWFLDFAFNLFIVALNQKLEERSIKRLKNPNMFWSTVHELFVASLFLRNGFEIRLEDEDDRSSRHPEFVAVHKATSAEFAVEAKLANQGIFSQSMDFRKWKVPKSFKFKHLLNDAINKNPKQPLVIVLDLNRLPNSRVSDQQAFDNRLSHEVKNNILPNDGSPRRWSRIAFVNRPFLLAASHGTPLTYSHLSAQSADPVYADSPIEAIWAINTAFMQIDVREHVKSLGQHLVHMMANTKNRFAIHEDRRTILFSPRPLDW